jgi:flagellar biosynthetic protein FliR
MSGAQGLDAMAGLVAGEILVGALLGLAARVMMSALNVAGQIIALQSGLSLAQIFDPTQQLQGAIVGGFLAILGTTLVFASDAHHLLLAALADSYFLARPGAPLAAGEMAELIVGTLSAAFSLGLRLAAPFALFGLVFYAGAGLLNRLMPQAQVFFMLMPANIALGILLLMLTTGLMMTTFLSAFEQFLSPFLR